MAKVFFSGGIFLLSKLEELEKYLRGLGRVAVAFSGGVDSTFLLKVAHKVLADDAVAVTAVSKFIPKRELEESKNFCNCEGVRQIFFTADVLGNKEIASNPPDRCYICKKNIFQNILRLAEENKIPYVLDGTNKDDEGDYRPGMRALEELQIQSPLRKLGFTKSDIRKLSKTFNLPTADKPAFACLASRIPYGEKISAEKLLQVDSAEQILQGEGFKQFRVRVHGNLARIEILPTDFDKMLGSREKISALFKNLGFDFVTLDLQGYRTGSMNIF